MLLRLLPCRYFISLMPSRHAAICHECFIIHADIVARAAITRHDYHHDVDAELLSDDA